MFPWMDKFLFTKNNFLPRLIKQESLVEPIGATIVHFVIKA